MDRRIFPISLAAVLLVFPTALQAQRNNTPPVYRPPPPPPVQPRTFPPPNQNPRSGGVYGNSAGGVQANRDLGGHKPGGIANPARHGGTRPSLGTPPATSANTSGGGRVIGPPKAAKDNNIGGSTLQNSTPKKAGATGPTAEKPASPNAGTPPAPRLRAGAKLFGAATAAGKGNTPQASGHPGGKDGPKETKDVAAYYDVKTRKHYTSKGPDDCLPNDQRLRCQFNRAANDKKNDGGKQDKSESADQPGKQEHNLDPPYKFPAP